MQKVPLEATSTTMVEASRILLTLSLDSPVYPSLFFKSTKTDFVVIRVYGET